VIPLRPSYAHTEELSSYRCDFVESRDANGDLVRLLGASGKASGGRASDGASGLPGLPEGLPGASDRASGASGRASDRASRKASE